MEQVPALVENQKVAREKELRRKDKKFLWHPFTQWSIWKDEEAPVIERGQGVELIDVAGNHYIDGVSSLWCNIHGHNVPEIANAISDQARKIPHSTLLGLSHVPSIELAEKLVGILPRQLCRIFFSDSGSAAVEAAIRIALEWQQKSSSGNGNKVELASLKFSYHGDTLGAVRAGFHSTFHSCIEKSLIRAESIHPPHYFRFYKGMDADLAEEKSLKELSNLFAKKGGELAAFIIEPLVQGAAGMWLHSENYLRELRKLTLEYGVFLIADEVATGFGKTGHMFACEKAEIVPDLLIMGKGLSGGVLPISAVATTEKIFSGFVGGIEEEKTFYFGQTFAGNPLAASAALANLELCSKKKFLAQIRQNINIMEGLIEKEIASLKHVDEVRQEGLMVGIELTKLPQKREPYLLEELVPQKIVRAACKKGLIIRPLGNVIVLMPPLMIGVADLAKLVALTAESIDEVTKKKGKLRRFFSMFFPKK